MRKRTFAAALLIIAVFVGTILADNPHFVEGPTFTDNGTTLTASGNIAGLGNAGGSASIVLRADLTATTLCHNPQGKVAPGQTKFLSVSTSGTFPIDSNGHVIFSLSTEEPTPGACPNGKWTGEVTDVTFSNVTISVNGQQIYP